MSSLTDMCTCDHAWIEVIQKIVTLLINDKLNKGMSTLRTIIITILYSFKIILNSKEQQDPHHNYIDNDKEERHSNHFQKDCLQTVNYKHFDSQSESKMPWRAWAFKAVHDKTAVCDFNTQNVIVHWCRC